jgi:hypothetical protein
MRRLVVALNPVRVRVLLLLDGSKLVKRRRDSHGRERRRRVGRRSRGARRRRRDVVGARPNSGPASAGHGLAQGGVQRHAQVGGQLLEPYRQELLLLAQVLLRLRVLALLLFQVLYSQRIKK